MANPLKPGRFADTRPLLRSFWLICLHAHQLAVHKPDPYACHSLSGLTGPLYAISSLSRLPRTLAVYYRPILQFRSPPNWTGHSHPILCYWRVQRKDCICLQVCRSVLGRDALSDRSSRFVPQANRALRYFNVFLNTKQAPRNWSLNPVRLLQSHSPPAVTSPTGTTIVSRSTSPASSTGRSSPRSKSPYSQTRSSVPLAPIPPSANPRGELIFSSKVTPAFREGYEKYRSEWEKRRRPSKYELSWAAYLKSYVLKPKPAPKSSAAAEKGSSSEKVRTKSAKSGIAYAASSPSEVSDDSSSSAAAAARGRDTRARPLMRTGSSSSLSSGLSISPPASRRSSPLRNSLSKASSPTSSRPTTPDLIREEDEYMAGEGKLGAHGRGFTSASDSSLASSMAMQAIDRNENVQQGKDTGTDYNSAD